MLLDQDQSLLGKKLVEAGLLDSDRLNRAGAVCMARGIPLPRYLIESGLAPKSKVYELLAKVYGVVYVDVTSFRIDPAAVRAIPGDLARRYKAIPLFKMEDTLNIAMVNPTDVAAIDHLAQKSGCVIEACLGAPEDIENALNEHCGAGSSVNQILEILTKEGEQRVTPDKKKSAHGTLPQPGPAREEDSHPVIELVDLIIKQAFEEEASDIHIEPEEKLLRIRYRVDGVMHEASTPPKARESEIISRIKILANMDIAENRHPQDGRIKMAIHGKEVDMRVSSVPTLYGENLVIRILKDSQSVLDLASLGCTEEMRKTFEELIRKPYGMILETGPTGSGKTTTLYAALSLLNSVDRNIVTIEDPIEYKLPLLRQIQVNPKAGMTFANALRSILRQDPDIIMVGEIRDAETAQIAIQSALTGHLVFSTLHTNTAAGAVTRLADMKVEPFLVSSSVIGVISQRLVRRICEKCKEPAEPPEWMSRAFHLPENSIPKIFRGKGCRHCHNTGYKGRIGIFEMLRITEEIQKKILANASSSEIEKAARQSGQPGIQDDALAKIAAGLTTPEEVVKTIDWGTNG